MKIPACGYCNALASDTLQDDVFARIEFVKDRIKVKNKKHLKSYEWSDEELAELGETLRSSVSAGSKKASTIREMIDYYGGYEMIFDILNEEAS